MIEIDGSYLEGGGQILRTSIALSAITGKPCRIVNIRQGRPKPGLQPQHLKSLETAAKMTNAKASGLEIGSQTVEFSPGPIRSGVFSIDTGTAGSVTLVMQALMPICLFAKSQCTLNVTGGTDVPWSPTIHYFKNVFLSSLVLFGMKTGEAYDLSIEKYGFYPAGGGKVRLRVRPFSKFEKINLTARGELNKYDMTSVASDELRGARVAERQIKSAEFFLGDMGKREVLYPKTLSPGSSFTAIGDFEKCKIGVSVLGKQYKKAELVGKGAAYELKAQMCSHACLDEHMADQILIYMALSKGSCVSVSKITNHCKTNMWVIEKFLPVKFNVKGNVISVA
jgi:RNA 3'-terminal phosphate cyclase (GTP)